MTKKILTSCLYPVLFLFWASLPANAQEVFVLDGTDIRSCGGLFTDSGGQAGQYAANENYTITICPEEGGDGSHVQLVFSATDFGAGDRLCFYDGSDTNAPMLACSDEFPLEFFIVQATAANASGCVTVTFESDATENGDGWEATINCIQACQTITAELASATPAVMPVDTGWIDICPGDVVRLTGRGNYPQNGVLYNHSDQNSNFTWDLGDGTTAVGPSIAHRFEEPGGYVIQLTIEDERGCKNNNFISQRVRVAPRPEFAVGENLPTQVCVEDTVQLTASIGGALEDYTVAAGPGEAVFYQPPMRADSLALPDGIGVPYETSIEVRDFRPGQVVQNASDIQSVCVNMEHSWMRDLQITLFCPSGDSVILHEYAGRQGGEVYLGNPNDFDSNTPVPGDGGDYCWIPDSPDRPTWINYANRFNPPVLPEGDYSPYQSFEQLRGCPLNGEWKIKVLDLWARDNGYIFSWGIDFDRALFPEIERFSPQIVDYGWAPNADIMMSQPDSISILTSSAGESSYTFTVTDEFGCVSDTTVSFTVLPETHPDCFDCTKITRELRDTVVCVGEAVQLNVDPGFEGVEEVRFSSNPNDRFGWDIFPHFYPINVNSVNFDILNDPLNQIASVCIDIDVDRTESLDITLISPDGIRLPLSLGNGNRTDGFPNTCFTPTATRLISNSNGPYVGEWLPQQSFTNLRGARVNGQWALEIWDNTIFRNNTMRSWSITFKPSSALRLSWDNIPGLSCYDCGNPVAAPNVTTTYYVQAEDDNDCFHRDSITIGVLRDLSPTTVRCSVTDENELTFSWDRLPDVPAYEVELFTNGSSTRTFVTEGMEARFQNLTPGDELRLDVGPNGAESCAPAVASAVCINEPCEFEIESVTAEAVSCFGGQDGAATVVISGGSGNFTYLWDDSLGQITPTANRLPAGTYIVRVFDETGCGARESVTISEPEPLELEVLATDVRCFAGSDGSAEALVEGGVPPYAYAWQDGQSAAKAVDLSLGTYTVEVRDSNGCAIQGQADIQQPATAVTATVIQSRQGCFGEANNELTAQPAGGEPPYNYLWPDEQRTQVAVGLDSVEYIVTVTDYNGCQTTAAFTPVDKRPIDPNIIADSPSCDGRQDGRLGVNFIEGGGSSDPMDYSFLWSTGDTTAAIENLMGGLEYAVTVTDADGCQGEESRFLSFPEPISFSIDFGEPSCAEGDDGFAEVVDLAGGNGMYRFQWSDNADGQTTARVEMLAAGTYYVTVSDSLNCETFDTVMLSEPAGMEINFAIADNECNGDREGVVQASVAGGTPGYAFEWSNGITEPQLSGLPAGDYELLVRDANGCEQTVVATVSEPPPLEADVMATDLRCFGDQNGMITVTPLGGTAPYQYRLNDEDFSSNDLFSRLSSGSYEVYVMDARNCTSLVDVVTINEPPEFRVDAGPEEYTLYLGDSTLLLADYVNGTGAIRFQWTPSFGDPLPCPDCEFAWVRPFYTTTYELFAVDANGCEARDQVQVNVLKPRILAVPTGFSPNNDGENDRLLVHGRAGTRVKVFQVYNRWGELLYEARDFDVNDSGVGWDGTFRDQPVLSGVYLYYLVGEFLDGEEKIRKGQTTLIR